MVRIQMALQMEGLHEEDEDQMARKGTSFFNVSDDYTQYQNYHRY